MSKKILYSLIALSAFVAYVFIRQHGASNLPIVAIANYGPHASLEASIQGIKEALEKQGFVENKNIRFEVTDVGFDSSLIPQMLTRLKSLHLSVMVVMTTPVAQVAKSMIKDVPLVFNVVTDPLEAGLLKNPNQPHDNISGVSDRQDLELFLTLATKLVPDARKIGVLYATGEANDTALVKMLNQAANRARLKVLAVAVDQARDVPLRMQAFRNAVDFIYVGASGPIQPTLPAIVAEADKMKIPVFNFDHDAVNKNQVLASFGVDYRQVGIHAGSMVGRILKGESISNLQPVYPGTEDHHGFVSRRKAESLRLSLPNDLTHITIVN